MTPTTAVTGPLDRIAVEPTLARVVVRVRGDVLADSSGALTMREAGYPAVQYVPLKDVDQSRLRRTSTSTFCSLKGGCSYFTITLPHGGHLVDAAWSYDEPVPALSTIAGHVAFFSDQVEVHLSNSQRGSSGLIY
jgi:uncharacterized protein (DUF427 family)